MIKQAKNSSKTGTDDYDGSTPLPKIAWELFISAFLSGGTKADAYRKAGYTTKVPTAASSQLLKNIKVQKRIAYKKAILAKQLNITEQGQMQRYRQIGLAAEKAGKFSDAIEAENRISAIMSIKTVPKDKQNMPNTMVLAPIITQGQPLLPGPDPVAKQVDSCTISCNNEDNSAI